MPRRASSCHVVPYSTEHKALVADLQRHLWSPDARLNASYLEWKYHQNPYIREPLIYLAFVGNKLVGMRGAFGTRWEVDDPAQVFTLPYPDDLVIDPEFRGQGLHRVMMDFALRDLARRGYPYAINLSASRTTLEASLKMQWRNAGTVNPLHRRTLRRSGAEGLASQARRLPLLWRWADNFLELSGRAGDHPFDAFDARFSAQNRSLDSGSLFSQKAPLVREMSQFVARLPRDGRIRQIRDEMFIAWRYSNPLREYRFLYAGRERLGGYIVLQYSPSVRGNSVCIVDWEAESEPIRAELLAAAIEYGTFPELCVWQLGASPSAKRMLERHGFKSLHEQHEKSILIRSIRDGEIGSPWILGGRRLDDSSQWDLRMIYSMSG